MAIANYSDLQGSIITWAAADEPTFISTVPDFVSLAEAVIRRRLDQPDLDTEESFTPVADTNGDYPTDYTVSLGDFRGIRSITFGTGNNIQTADYRTPEMFSLDTQRSTGAAPGTESAWIYTILDDVIRFNRGPTADFVIIYKAVLPPLTDLAPTNWLMTNFPDVYLQGSMVEASAFEKDTEAEGKWLTRFDNGLNEMKTYLDNRRYAGVSLTTRVA
jgi:hypothetical protein